MMNNNSNNKATIVKTKIKHNNKQMFCTLQSPNTFKPQLTGRRGGH